MSPDLAAAAVVPPRRTRRRRRAVLAAAAIVLAAAVFALWGPVGLGNGPLNAGEGAIEGGSDPHGTPVGFIIPVTNSGRAPAVIDGVDLIGRTQYDAPRLLALGVLTTARCGGTWPARRTRNGFVLAGCGGPRTGPLIGRPISHDTTEFPAAVEVAAPQPGSCWVMTAIVVHYHVGIRHYSATDPYRLAECASDAQVDAAMTAAQNAP